MPPAPAGEVSEVVVEAFEFGDGEPRELDFVRQVDAREPFERPRVGEGTRGAAAPADPRNQTCSAGDVEPLDEPLDATVRIRKLRVQVDDRLAA
jgi:hypothetical protein